MRDMSCKWQIQKKIKRGREGRLRSEERRGEEGHVND